MSPVDAEGRPPAGTAHHSAVRDSTSMAPTTDRGTTSADAAALVELLDGALVLVVRTAAGRHRRRTFLALRSAERAAARARAAGYHAELVLCQLVPVRLLAGATEQTGRAA